MNMSLLEAISPTARALLAEFSEGGGKMNIIKNTKRGCHRIHVLNGLVPLCGGGHGARAAQWQEVILEPDCKRCLAILEKRNNKPKDKK
jgi:hypothetical protein